MLQIVYERLRIRAKWNWVWRSENVVTVELATSKTLGPVVGNWGQAIEPSEYLTWAQAFQIMALGPTSPNRDQWRLLWMRSTVPNLAHENLFDHYIDLSDASPERDVVARLCEQDELPVVWVNEGIEIPWTVEARQVQAWRLALKNTEGISAKDYREIVEDSRWYHSPSYRPGIPRPRPYRRRSAKPPEAMQVPFFAKRTGQILRTGTPELGSIQLPKGARQPGHSPAYWASDEPVRDLGPLLPGLADMFPQTGVWPVVWSFNDVPEGYMGGGHQDIDEIDEIDINKLLADRSAHYSERNDRDDIGFSGLAPGQPTSNNAIPPSLALPPPAEPAYLLLVPCNRPADAVASLGGIGAVTPATTISAVLRSWEERFGAVFYSAEPEVTRLAITRPLQHQVQAQKLAAELHTLNPEMSETIDRTASRLLNNDPANADLAITATNWVIDWPKAVW